MPLHDAGILEQFHGAVDGRYRDPAVDQRAPAKQFLDIRVVLAPRKDTRDDPPLLGHAHALRHALSLDVIRLHARHSGFRHLTTVPDQPCWKGPIFPLANLNRRAIFVHRHLAWRRRSGAP
jgi:hypothetical protein